MKKFDAIIIGTGQSGPSLAARFSKEKLKVAIIERKNFGGSCTNFGCIPTKTYVANAEAAQTVRDSEKYGVFVGNFFVDMKKVKKRKDEIVRTLSGGVKKWMLGLEGCSVFQGHGRFEDPHTVRVNDEVITADKIFLDVGSRANIPDVPGLNKIPFYTNVSLLDIDFLPDHLLILGGGYIALEFAQIFRRFGSRVTVFQRHPFVMPKEDEDISLAIQEILEKEGIQIITNAKDFQILPHSRENKIIVQVDMNGKKVFEGTHLLVATGRAPNTDDLGAEKANLKKDAKGFIVVDDELKTSQPHIWAMGDCNGRGAFTHTSVDDFHIISENLFEKGSRKVSERVPIYALFTAPPFGRVGMTEKQLKDSNLNVLAAKIPMSRVLRARAVGDTSGFMKVYVDGNSKQILGAAILGIHADEAIQSLATMMYAKAPYTVMEKGVYIHPTVNEYLPTLLEGLKPIRELAHA